MVAPGGESTADYDVHDSTTFMITDATKKSPDKAYNRGPTRQSSISLIYQKRCQKTNTS